MPEMLRWETLLSARRLGRFDKEADALGPRSPFQRDYDRILFSSAFRRLQDKTQVFPLAKNDYVRTRLTHSLEVSSVGRSLGVMVGDELIKRHAGLSNIGITSHDFGTIVSAACLAHDIGNPPFGHAGESAISEWFTSEIGMRVLETAEITGAHAADFTSFEGNAQGFRILTHLSAEHQPGGMQATAAVLGAFTKYPRASSVSTKLPKTIATKKFGFMQAERELFETLASELGLLRIANGVQAWYRHPLAYLVEAADDICYRIMDVEDGLKTRYLALDEVEPLFISLLDAEAQSRAQSLPESQRIDFMRAKAINTAIGEVVECFLRNEDAFLAGAVAVDLMELVPSSNKLKEFKLLARKKVYNARPVLEIEGCGYRVIAGLLELFVLAAEDIAIHGQSAKNSSRGVVRLLGTPEELLTPSRRYELYLWLTDYISGMTDSYAIDLYQRLYGIKLP